MTSPAAAPEPPRLAAIDVGTNSIRLVVAEVQPDATYRVLDEEREMTRLGRGVEQTGLLSEAAMELSLEVLGKMKAIADGFRVRALRAIATSAVREASNGVAFCREARRRSRLKIQVVSPQDEAELAFQSVRARFDLEGRSVAALDMGGGSVELVLAAGPVVDQVHSLPLGAVRMTERFARSDPLRRRDHRRLIEETDRVFKRRIGKLPFSAPLLIGSGGTFTTLAHMLQYERDGQTASAQGYPISFADLVHLADRLRETPLEERRRIPGLNPLRADIIVAGAIVIARLAERLRSPRIVVNEGGIRDGLLLSMIAALPGVLVAPEKRPRERLDSVRALAQKCRSNHRHCEHVARLAGDIFDGLVNTWDAPPHARDLLVAAALLHDIGYVINHSKHHKHAYHLIVHADLPGFAAHDVELIANVARYHRRALPKKSHANFARLPRSDRSLVRRLSGILRVADGLDRTHTQCVRGVRCRPGQPRTRIVLDAAAHPRVEIWDAERKASLFQTAFDTTLELVWRGQEPAAVILRARAGPGRKTARA